MTNEERWNTFMSELKAYIEEHQKCPPKHCTLYNAQKYYRRKMKEGSLDEEKALELESVLGLRDLSLHTGGRRKKEEIKSGSVTAVTGYGYVLNKDCRMHRWSKDMVRYHHSKLVI